MENDHALSSAFFWIFGAIVGASFASCKLPPAPEPPPDPNPYEVQFLFEEDGVKLYRFRDWGEQRYFAVQKGHVETSWSDRRSNGDNTVVTPHVLPTITCPAEQIQP